jgi:hypothetical protein
LDIFGVNVTELTKVQLKAIISLYLNTLSLVMPVDVQECSCSSEQNSSSEEDEQRINQARINTLHGFRRIIGVDGGNFTPITVSIMGTEQHILGLKVAIYNCSYNEAKGFFLLIDENDWKRNDPPSNPKNGRVKVIDCIKQFSLVEYLQTDGIDKIINNLVIGIRTNSIYVRTPQMTYSVVDFLQKSDFVRDRAVPRVVEERKE